MSYNQNDKAHCERRHAKKRAYQRYGLVINRLKINKIVNDIQNNKAEFLFKQSLTRVVYLVVIENIKCLVVYDKKRHTICTFLPSPILIEFIISFFTFISKITDTPLEIKYGEE